MRALHAYALACCKVGKEIWVQAPGSRPGHEISNMGRERNRAKWWIITYGHEKAGYLHSTKSKAKCARIHRLVGIAFIPNPKNKPIIDHIDRNKHNNRLDNLRWCTTKENNDNKNKIPHDIQRLMSSRPVWKLSTETNEQLQYFETIRDAAYWIFNSGRTSIKDFNGGNNIKTQISAVAQGKRRIAFGFSWKYAESKIHGEVWKEVNPEHIKGIEGCKVSSHARIMNHKGKISVGSTRHGSGRCSFQISRVVNGKTIHAYINRHRLVALTFLLNDDPCNKTQVDHIDGDYSNDSLYDAYGKLRLEWVTPAENVRRMYALKRLKKTI